MEAAWDRLYHTRAEGIAALTVQSISVLILCTLFLHFIIVDVIPTRKAAIKKRKKGMRYIRILCILCFVFSIIYCITNLSFHALITFVHHIACPYRTWAIYILLCQRITLYWFYIFRLRLAFQKSAIKVQNLYIYLAYFMTFITIVSTVAIYYTFTVNNCTDNMQSIAIVPALFLDTFLCCFLSIWFVLKLRQSIVYFHSDGNAINRNVVLLMCKLTNIVIWSSIILQLLQWTLAYLSGWIISFITLNVVTTCCAMLFTFAKYHKFYKTYICCLCHQCIIKWCSIKMTSHLKKSSLKYREAHRLKKELEDIGDKSDENEETEEDDEDQGAQSPLVVHVENKNDAYL